MQIQTKLIHKNTASAGWQRLRLGEFEITAISDGELPLTANAGFETAPEAEIAALLDKNYLPPTQLNLGQNCILVNTGRKLVLIDTGMGDSMGDASHMFGPTTGHMLTHLKAAGFQPEDIDMVLLTHAHADHAWGLTDRAGLPIFPNAELALAEAEYKFWTDEANQALSPFTAINVQGGRHNLTPYRDRLVMVRDGQAVCAGISALASPGHSPGHFCYMIESSGQSVINLGDLAHHHVLALARPDWPISYDSDPNLAVTSRRKILDQIASEGHQVLGYHFPWPGLGHIQRASQGYEWFASPTTTYFAP